MSNTVLAGLPPHALAAIADSLEPVAYSCGIQLLAPDQEGLFFPETGLISLQVRHSEWDRVEVDQTGRDGVVGLSRLIAEGQCGLQAWALSDCAGFALDASAARHALGRSPSLRRALGQVLAAQMEALALRSASHACYSLRQRVARWLLAADTRLEGATLCVTQEELAMLLQCRRSGVTNVMTDFRNAGLLIGVRGRIDLLNRDGLRQAAGAQLPELQAA
jgi:CRP-like cAMP-binding protein